MSYIATCHTDVFIHVDVHTCTCVLNASCTYMCTSCMHVEECIMYMCMSNIYVMQLYKNTCSYACAVTCY